jgi:hypothetical protein
MGKVLIIVGLVLVISGLLIQYMPEDGLPRLPGDIYIKENDYSFYFPLGWCVLISIILSIVFWLTGK